MLLVGAAVMVGLSRCGGRALAARCRRGGRWSHGSSVEKPVALPQSFPCPGEEEGEDPERRPSEVPEVLVTSLDADAHPSPSGSVGSSMWGAGERGVPGKRPQRGARPEREFQQSLVPVLPVSVDPLAVGAEPVGGSAGGPSAGLGEGLCPGMPPALPIIP